jgi:hypothetical protein
MWDDFVSAIFTTFCEPAFVRLRQENEPDGPYLSPRQYRYQAPTTGPNTAGELLDYLHSRRRPPSVGRLDLKQLSPDSLSRIGLLDSTLPITTAARQELAAPKRGSLSPTFGLRPRTDDLLAAYVLRGWPVPPPPHIPEAGPTWQQISTVHGESLRRFFQLFTRETPTVAALLAQTAMEAALQTLGYDDCCDDVFRVRCFEPILSDPLAAGNTLPRGTLPALHPLESRLVELFDQMPAVVPSPPARGGSLAGPPDPEGRLMLYLSYFGRLNAILIADLLGRPFPRVVDVLEALWDQIRNLL